MVYLDYAATTPLNEEVASGYKALLDQYFYNADSIYDKGIEVNQLQEKSRELIGQMLKVKTNEIIFTSCGSEANATAIKGVAFSYANRGKHIITTAVEHSSVYETCLQLEKVFGFEVTYLPVLRNGQVDLEVLKKSIRKDTILVSIMAVNNEVGAINPISKIKQIIAQNPNTKLHVDMVQALGKMHINLEGIDLASFSAHKINGLKGSGFLYKKDKCNITSLICGGQQEFGLRGGTSNACTNIILAKTMRLALSDLDLKIQKVQQLNQYIRQQLHLLENVVMISDEQSSLPNIINFAVVYYKPEVIVHYLESKNVYISTRSACSSKTESVSRVLKQLNLEQKIAQSAMRISISSHTTKEEIDYFISSLKEAMKNIKKQR